MEIHDCRRSLVRLVCRRRMGHAGDIVRILMKLTLDVERFDSKVVLQRKLLQDMNAQPDALEQLNLDAAEIAAQARHALDELRSLSVSRSD